MASQAVWANNAEVAHAYTLRRNMLSVWIGRGWEPGFSRPGQEFPGKQREKAGMIPVAVD